MSWSLFDAKGLRKYLTPAERAAFISAAFKTEPIAGSFCLTLALTGARISEVLALTSERLDVSDNAIVLETLKRRRRGQFRAVPVPEELMIHLLAVHGLSLPPGSRDTKQRLWKFSRPTAWKRVRDVMYTAGIGQGLAKPKALRHAFAVEAVQQRIALSVIKKWLGHAKIETTALYTEPVGDEERALARLTWQAVPGSEGRLALSNVMVKSPHMWKDLSPAIEAAMPSRKNRYLAFIDYLGTRQLYSNSEKNAERIEDRRYELEHAVHFRLQRAIASRKIEIGIFSDTILIAGEAIEEVLTASAELLAFVLKKTINRADSGDVRLLRGGISGGLELRSQYLAPSPGVSVIPFFDASLAFAYEIENVRRGSRLYLDERIPRSVLDGVSRYVFPWKQMTGFGRATADVHEFLWPAFIFKDDQVGLSILLDKSVLAWRSMLKDGPADPDGYRSTLYHFDETIKVIIRSFMAFNALSPESVATLLTALPRIEDKMEDCGIRYIWGIWFQVAYVFIRHGLAEVHLGDFQFMADQLRRRKYFDKFIAEADSPDYEIMRPFLRKLRAH